MKIMLITDAWEPQVNGVVTTMKRVIEETEAAGHVWEVVSPADGFPTVPLPTYSEIKLALFARRKIEDRFHEFEPDAVHIVTEGPLGMAGRAMCLKLKHPFSTAYHTRFPEYLSARLPVPVGWGYAFVRWFHQYSGKVMVPTPSMVAELTARGFKNTVAWSRGVDTARFHPGKRVEAGAEDDPFPGLARPIFINVGRVAVEKNIEAFLKLDLPGTKVVVGDGPHLETLKSKYPGAHYTGARFGDDLARLFASADVFVFPSLTDTFGLVVLEAMASGTPVAAFDATGPRDVIPGSNAGVIADGPGGLAKAAMDCLVLSRAQCRTYAEGYSWRACAEDFVEYLQPLPPPERRRFWTRLRLGRRKTRPGPSQQGA
ncbi:MAG: glycosyltransferase family 1 protein [Pseudomonadota bacterium]